MGQEGAWTAGVSFTDVRVPASSLVGGSEDVGYRAAMISWPVAASTSRHCRWAPPSVPSTNRSPAATATQGGTPIGDFQLVQAMLADQQTGVMAGRALVRDCARKWVTEEDRRLAPSAAKLFCTEMVGKVASGGADPRRHRLHARGARRTDLSRRAAAAPVRGAPARFSASFSVRDLSSREEEAEGLGMSGNVLAGKTAVITGGAQGLGFAIAERYVAEGAGWCSAI